MRRISWWSALALPYRRQAESLVYFNDKQCVWQDSILEISRRFGRPEIYEENHRIRLGTAHRGLAQGLFGLHRGKIVGAIAYTRIDDELLVLHLAALPLFTVSESGTASVFVQSITLLKSISQRIAGIEKIVLFPFSSYELKIGKPW